MSLWNLGADHANRNSIRVGLGGPAMPSNVQTALSALGKYIPSETTTIFLAWLGIIAVAKGSGTTIAPFQKVIFSEWSAYWTCSILTPIFVYLAAKTNWHQVIPVANPFVLPKWRITAATIAFLVWGLAVPGFSRDPILSLIFSLGAILISPILVSVEQAFGLDK